MNSLPKTRFGVTLGAVKRSTTSSGSIAPAEPTVPSALAEAAAIGADLADSIRAVVESCPGVSLGPSAIAGRLGLNRPLVSRTLGSIRCDDPLEMLQRIPGPETLRSIVTAMGKEGVAAARVKSALRSIDRFDDLIRDRYGTRSTFNAAICAHAPAMQRRLESESRQRVFAGMRELRGFEADAWFSSNLLVPDRDDPTRITVFVVQGFIGLRQLRPDIPVTFDFAPRGEGEAAPERLTEGTAARSMELVDLCTNPPARLELAEDRGRKVYRLAQEQLGKDVAYDMLSFMRAPRCMPRFAGADGRLTGPFALAQAPVKTLLFDILLADGLDDGSAPELFVFAPGLRAGIDVNDRAHDIDRVEVTERIEVLPPSPDRFDVPEVPNYAQMVERMAGLAGHDLDSLRLHRLHVDYPPFGFEFVSSFRLRRAPG